jgi:hypothetical protein
MVKLEFCNRALSEKTTEPFVFISKNCFTFGDYAGSKKHYP